MRAPCAGLVGLVRRQPGGSRDDSVLVGDGTGDVGGGVVGGCDVVGGVGHGGGRAFFTSWLGHGEKAPHICSNLVVKRK